MIKDIIVFLILTIDSSDFDKGININFQPVTLNDKSRAFSMSVSLLCNSNLDYSDSSNLSMDYTQDDLDSPVPMTTLQINGYSRYGNYFF